MNKVMLIGNVGQDPEVHYYDRDQCVARVRLATTERGYTLQNGTQVPDRTYWHSVIFYRKLAKIVEQYVHKGDKLYVEGRLRPRTWDDKKGVRHYDYEIDVDNMEMFGVRYQEGVQVSQNTQTQAVQPQATHVQPQATQSQTATSPDEQNNEVLPF